MSNPIGPDATPRGKSDPAPKNPKNKTRLLSGWIEDTERALEALQAWLNKLKSWRDQDQVSLKEFEAAYAVIRRADLEEWAKMGIDKLRAVVAGEQTESE